MEPYKPRNIWIGDKTVSAGKVALDLDARGMLGHRYEFLGEVYYRPAIGVEDQTILDELAKAGLKA